MKLVTLGGLELDQGNFRQARLLLLLAYLSLEGTKTRRFIADLFWSDANNPMNNVAVATSKLRKLGLLDGDDTKLWVTVPCDATKLREQLQAGQLSAVQDYTGAFLDSFDLHYYAGELEEWVYTTRETLAHEVRAALLQLAEQCASIGQFDLAAQHAERACKLPGAALLEPEDMARLHLILLAAQHPYQEVLEREAKEMGLPLHKDTDQAKKQLRRSVIGREGELARLRALEPGGWLWLKGGPGIGKTVVLRELATNREGSNKDIDSNKDLGTWRYVLGRAGLPYATLEPLLGSPEGGEEVLLRKLAAQKDSLLLDGWENIDPESQRVFNRLCSLKPAFRVVIASRQDASSSGLPVDALLELSSLTKESLSNYSGAFEATLGVPALVGAWLRGEALETALQHRLATLSETSRYIHSTLALLENPDISMVRQALSIDPVEYAQALDELLLAGLIESSGLVRGRDAVLQHLAGQPSTLAKLSLAVARFLPPLEALPLFQRARAFWQDADLSKVSASYHAVAKETLRRGFPMQAANLLAEAPVSPEISLLRGRALEQAGNYKDALVVVEPLEDNPDVLALKAAVYRQLGKFPEAKAAAEEAIKGDMEAKAEGLNTLGHLEFAQGNFTQAEILYSRAASLFKGLGDNERWLIVLNNRAYAAAEMGEDVEEAYKEVLEAAKDNLHIQTQALINIGRVFEKKNAISSAEKSYLASIDVAAQISAYDFQLVGWLNVGALYHRQEQFLSAKSAYEKALLIARETSNRFMMGLVLSNLAELTGDVGAWQEAIELLEAAGEQEMANQSKTLMNQFIESSELPEAV
ncbi:MAG: tetratricopeptide repeat protein [Trueperaceae bacterium]